MRRPIDMRFPYVFAFVLAEQCLAAGDPWVPIADGPDGWQAQAPRKEIAPTCTAKESASDEGGPRLSISSGGRFEASGAWVRGFPVPPGRWVRFTAHYQAKDVELERRSVLARLIFQDASGKKIGQAEYPATSCKAGPHDGRTITSVYRVPAKANSARVELLLRWTKKGSVEWYDISLTPAENPGKRLVKIAAVNYRPGRRTKGPDENRDLFAEKVAEAAKGSPDIIVLGEGVTVVNTGKTYVDVAEVIPGPSTKRFGALSKKHGCYIVAGIYERVGKIVYNTAILTGPDGLLVGTYRKTCLPREEIEGGITPGASYPVFDTRFGKVGMMICWDIHFPEVARRLTMNGAELILVPIWGGNELLLRARAVENQVFVATSSYSSKLRTAVWDRRGDALAEAKEPGEIALAEVDLNARTQWPWLGDFGARIPRERPPREAE